MGLALSWGVTVELVPCLKGIVALTGVCIAVALLSVEESAT